MRMNIEHPSHRCGLAASYLPNPYVCDGCKEEGIGWRYACQACDFDLHSCCAASTNVSSLLMHPFHKEEEHALQFLFNPNNGRRNFSPPCNACGNPVQGFAYRCVASSCGYVLHPCCAHLPATMTVPLIDSSEPAIETAPRLELSLHNGLVGQCEFCGGSAPGWAYATPSLDYCVHVACARKMLLETAKSSHALSDHSHQSQGGRWTQRLSLQRINKTPKRGKFRGIFRSAAFLVKSILSALFGDPGSLIVAAATLLQANSDN